MKSVAGTPWGPVVVDSSIERIPRWKQYLQREVWQGYAGFMYLTDMSTTHLRNLERFLLDRTQAVLRDARTGRLYELLHEPVPEYSDLLMDDIFIDDIDDVPLLQAVRELIRKREKASPEVKALERHLWFVREQLDQLADNEERTRHRLFDLTGERY